VLQQLQWLLHVEASCTVNAEGAPFGADSQVASVGTHCSGCIANVPSNVRGELKECCQTIEGFGGVCQFQVYSNAMHWTWDDDEGVPLMSRQFPIHAALPMEALAC